MVRGTYPLHPSLHGHNYILHPTLGGQLYSLQPFLIQLLVYHFTSLSSSARILYSRFVFIHLVISSLLVSRLVDGWFQMLTAMIQSQFTQMATNSMISSDTLQVTTTLNNAAVKMVICSHLKTVVLTILFALQILIQYASFETL